LVASAGRKVQMNRRNQDIGIRIGGSQPDRSAAVEFFSNLGLKKRDT
jgi:hypothetical protein